MNVPPRGGACGADSQLTQFNQHTARSADSQLVVMIQEALLRYA